MAYPEPPFPIPSAWKNQAPHGFREIKVLPISDGEPRHWQGKSLYRPSDERNYLLELATSWASKDGKAERGVAYYLDKLPDGYACFEIDQPNGEQPYKRLFGHPSGRFYDSVKRFEAHFLWLMNGMQNDCECILCNTSTLKPFAPRPTALSRQASDGSLPKDRRRTRDTDDGDSSTRSDSIGPITAERAQRRARRQARQAQAPRFVDGEGTEDVWKDGLRKLKNAAGSKLGIEIDIEEPSSMDWKAERSCLPRYLTQIDQQHSFIPRVGELVLWCPDWRDDHFLIRNPVTEEYKFYSHELKCFRGFPLWRGGIVATVPTAISQNGPIDFADILDTPNKKTSYNTAGFRIETAPDPNNDLDKSFSKQHRYVPLRNIRPLSHWALLLKGIDESILHESVTNSLTNMTSISLVDKFRLNGSWPHGTIFSRGIYLGAELITVGDAVRLKSSEPATVLPVCSDVLVVESIRYHLRDCKAEHTHHHSPQLCSQSLVTFVGQAYTTDLRRSHEMLKEQNSSSPEPVIVSHPIPPDEIKGLFRPVGSNDYGPWFPLHTSLKRYEVSHEQVLGRLYEADAVRLWCGLRQTPLPNEHTSLLKPGLGFDAESILRGRSYATQSDARLPEPIANMTSWHIQDFRAQALAIATINGLEVGFYHGLRTPATLRSWRAHLKIAEGVKPEDTILQDLKVKKPLKLAEHQAEKNSKRRDRPRGSKLIDGKSYFENEHVEGQTEIDDNDETHSVTQAEKYSSQMESAALVISDEEETSGETNHEGKSGDHYVSPPAAEDVHYVSRHFGSKTHNAIGKEINGSLGIHRPIEKAASTLGKPHSNNQNLSKQASRSRSGSVQGAPLSSHISVGQSHPGEGSNNISDGEKSRTARSNSEAVALEIAESQNVPSMHGMHQEMSFDDNETNRSSQSSASEEDNMKEEDDNDYYDDDDDDDDEDSDDWADPRNARGGTEESDGGDYHPSQ